MVPRPPALHVHVDGLPGAGLGAHQALARPRPRPRPRHGAAVVEAVAGTHGLLRPELAAPAPALVQPAKLQHQALAANDGR